MESLTAEQLLSAIVVLLLVGLGVWGYSLGSSRID